MFLTLVKKITIHETKTTAQIVTNTHKTKWRHEVFEARERLVPVALEVFEVLGVIFAVRAINTPYAIWRWNEHLIVARVPSRSLLCVKRVRRCALLRISIMTQGPDRVPRSTRRRFDLSKVVPKAFQTFQKTSRFWKACTVKHLYPGHL